MEFKMEDIDNTQLEESMQAYAKEPGKESLMRLVMALKDTQLFVPATPMPVKGGFQPYILKNPAGDMYMPAFTCQAKIPKNQKYRGMLRIQYKQCVAMLLDSKAQVQGIALNPYADNLMLKTQMLELSRKVENQTPLQMKTVNIKADDFHMISRHSVEFYQIPKQLYEGKLEFISQLSEKAFLDLYKAPYAEIRREGQCPYTEDDFEIMELQIREDLNIMQIITPSKCLFRTNCKELYIVWNAQAERISYYVIEKGEGKRFILSAYKEGDGTWENLGEAPAEGNVLNRVMELFEAGQEA